MSVVDHRRMAIDLGTEAFEIVSCHEDNLVDADDVAVVIAHALHPAGRELRSGRSSMKTNEHMEKVCISAMLQDANMYRRCMIHINTEHTPKFTRPNFTGVDNLDSRS